MRNDNGFTLIELIVVVAIIGILAAIAIPQFTKFRSGAHIDYLKDHGLTYIPKDKDNAHKINHKAWLAHKEYYGGNHVPVDCIQQKQRKQEPVEQVVVTRNADQDEKIAALEAQVAELSEQLKQKNETKHINSNGVTW